jgi:hypothetical protein
MFMTKIKANNDAISAPSKKPEQKSPTEQPLKVENLLTVKPKENLLAGILSKTNSTLAWPKLQSPKFLLNKRASLPPVELSIKDPREN